MCQIPKNRSSVCVVVLSHFDFKKKYDSSDYNRKSIGVLVHYKIINLQRDCVFFSLNEYISLVMAEKKYDHSLISLEKQTEKKTHSIKFI